MPVGRYIPFMVVSVAGRCGFDPPFGKNVRAACVVSQPSSFFLNDGKLPIWERTACRFDRMSSTAVPHANPC
jgi:hypothetical protein